MMKTKMTSMMMIAHRGLDQEALLQQLPPPPQQPLRLNDQLISILVILIRYANMTNSGELTGLWSKITEIK